MPDQARSLSAAQQPQVRVGGIARAAATTAPHSKTEDYAYEIHRAGRYLTDPPDIDARVEARLERQRRLVDSTPFEMRAVVTEEVLRRPVGGATALRGQLEHFVSMAKQRNILLQVRPLSAGAYACQTGSLTVLRFEQGEDVAFLESPLGGRVVDSRAEFAACRYLFVEVRASAMSAAQSLDLVRGIADDITLQEQEQARMTRARRSGQEQPVSKRWKPR